MRAHICLYLLLITAGFWVPASASVQSYDFRVVIDVSGSMKQTDPHNLRVPALKLVNGLIPQDSLAGVWIFGRYVDMAVEWGKVDEAWRQLADQGADKIHSNALFTNIESALARASVGWNKPDTKRKRILLLLTDGKVDISKDAEKNRQSRDKVLSKSLAALKKAGAEVHSIALSQQSDEVLLRQLALETGGSFALAQTAEELQKVFFKMFERAASPDSVALEGREFKIDPSIREMTLLIFRQPGSQPTLLIPPDSAALSAAKPRGSRWRSDAGYDLITVRKPESGIWRIDADMDPDNRLMVVTDLQLKAEGIPAYSSPGQALDVFAELYNRQEKIRKNSFLRFVEFGLTHVDSEGNSTDYELSHTSERDHKGRYLMQLAQKLTEGTHQFVVTADSRTFNRSKRFNLEVQWPAEVRIEPGTAAGNYQVKVRAREEYLKPDGFVAEVELEAPDGSRGSLPMELVNGWLRGQVETDQDGIYRAHVQISAQSNSEAIVDISLGSFPMLGLYRAPVTSPVDPEAAEESTEPAPAEPDTGDDIDWRLVGIVIVGVNLLLMVMLVVGWLVLRRKKIPDELILDDEEEVSA